MITILLILLAIGVMFLAELILDCIPFAMFTTELLVITIAVIIAVGLLVASFSKPVLDFQSTLFQ